MTAFTVWARSNFWCGSSHITAGATSLATTSAGTTLFAGFWTDAADCAHRKEAPITKVMGRTLTYIPHYSYHSYPSGESECGITRYSCGEGAEGLLSPNEGNRRARNRSMALLHPIPVRNQTLQSTHLGEE